MKIVAVIDDNTSYNKMISKSLEKEGYEVLSFTSPRTAIDQLKNRKVNLVLCDYMMPEIDGANVISELKKYNDSPCWLLSASHDLTRIDTAYKAGAVRYCFKDENRSQLLNDIHHFFNFQDSKKIASGKYITAYSPIFTSNLYELEIIEEQYILHVTQEFPVGSIISVNNSRDKTQIALKIEEIVFLDCCMFKHICRKL